MYSAYGVQPTISQDYNPAAQTDTTTLSPTTMNTPEKKTRPQKKRQPSSAAVSKRFLCDLCDESFTTSGHLARHRASSKHSTVRLYACPFPKCGKLTNRSDNLKQHYRTHFQVGARRKSGAAKIASFNQLFGTKSSPTLLSQEPVKTKDLNARKAHIYLSPSPYPESSSPEDDLYDHAGPPPLETTTLDDESDLDDTPDQPPPLAPAYLAIEDDSDSSNGSSPITPHDSPYTPHHNVAVHNASGSLYPPYRGQGGIESYSGNPRWDYRSSNCSNTSIPSPDSSGYLSQAPSPLSDGSRQATPLSLSPAPPPAFSERYSSPASSHSHKAAMHTAVVYSRNSEPQLAPYYSSASSSSSVAYPAVAQSAARYPSSTSGGYPAARAYAQQDSVSVDRAALQPYNYPSSQPATYALSPSATTGYQAEPSTAYSSYTSASSYQQQQTPNYPSSQVYQDHHETFTAPHRGYTQQYPEPAHQRLGVPAAQNSQGNNSAIASQYTSAYPSQPTYAYGGQAQYHQYPPMSTAQYHHA